MNQILLLISHKPNAKLLREWLSPRYTVTCATHPELLASAFDLCIIDGPTLDRCLPEVQQRREQAEAALLPFLLVTSREDLGLATRHLWRSVDEVVVQPVQRVELQARVEVLMRARELSRQIHRQTQILEMICSRAPLEVVLEAIGQFIQAEVGTGSLQHDLRHEALVHRGSTLARLAMDQHRFEQLRRSQLSVLAEGMADGVVAADRSGQILVLNPAARRLLGISPVRAPAEALLPAPLLQVLLATAAADGGSTERLQLQHGETELSVLISPLGSDQWRQGAIALIRDTTMEARYRRLQEKFIANTSHELRGPLAAISASLEALHDGLVPEQHRTRYVKGVLDEVQRLRRLSEDIIGLSTIDQGVAHLYPTSFDLHILFESVDLVWGARCEKAGLRLKIEYQSLHVTADYDRVEQVVRNLLENAVRHTPRGGEITLSASTEDGMARVAVSDTGEGITAEHLPMLWDRFYKVDQARTRSHKSGSGLGLSIVKELVERMGGTVFLHSEPGRGSTFGFTLPLYEGPLLP